MTFVSAKTGTIVDRIPFNRYAVVAATMLTEQGKVHAPLRGGDRHTLSPEALDEPQDLARFSVG